MLKILKNLKESILLVIAIIILLCVQAAADLNLPDFTSKIVNVGLPGNCTSLPIHSCSNLV